MFGKNQSFHSMTLEELKHMKVMFNSELEAEIMVKQNPDSLTARSLLVKKFSEPYKIEDIRSKSILFCLGVSGVRSVDLWTKLPIDFVYREIIGENLTFYITIDGKEISLFEKELNTYKKFVEEMLSTHQIFLPIPSPKLWGMFVMYLQNIALERRKIAIEDEKTMISELVRNYIETSVLTDKIEEALRYNYLLKDGANVWILNENLRDVVKAGVGKDIGYRAIAEALKATAHGSSPKRLPNGKLKRFWSFEAGSYQLKEQVSNNDTPPSPQPQLNIQLNQTLQNMTDLVKPTLFHSTCSNCGGYNILTEYEGKEICLSCMNTTLDARNSELEPIHLASAPMNGHQNENGDGNVNNGNGHNTHPTSVLKIQTEKKREEIEIIQAKPYIPPTTDLKPLVDFLKENHTVIASCQTCGISKTCTLANDKIVCLDCLKLLNQGNPYE